jgi:hypothetical protein
MRFFILRISQNPCCAKNYLSYNIIMITYRDINGVISTHKQNNEKKCIDLSEKYVAEIIKVDDPTNLVNLTEIALGFNELIEIKWLDNFINLTGLTLRSNKITEIKGLDNLINLKSLDLSFNNIFKIKGLDNLINLNVLDLSYNKITEVKELDNLINLMRLYLQSNKITKIPLTIMNLRGLYTLRINLEINPIIERFLNRNTIKEGKTIYDDSQNVHNSHIVESIKKSIYNLMTESSESKMLSLDTTLKEIVDDKVLDEHTKQQLVEYCQDKTVHSIANVTFDEVLCFVWFVINKHKNSEEIKKILIIEMKDSLCMCFTGRLSRLVNCLNGFDDRVSVVISDKQEILNIIIKTRNMYVDNIEKQKEFVTKELLERGYDNEIINEYLIYLE